MEARSAWRAAAEDGDAPPPPEERLSTSTRAMPARAAVAGERGDARFFCVCFVFVVCGVF
jgi:hypothetical protein